MTSAAHKDRMWFELRRRKSETTIKVGGIQCSRVAEALRACSSQTWCSSVDFTYCCDYNVLLYNANTQIHLSRALTTLQAVMVSNKVELLSSSNPAAPSIAAGVAGRPL